MRVTCTHCGHMQDATDGTGNLILPDPRIAALEARLALVARAMRSHAEKRYDAPMSADAHLDEAASLLADFGTGPQTQAEGDMRLAAWSVYQEIVRENARLRAAWDGLAAALPEWDREVEGAQHAIERLRADRDKTEAALREMAERISNPPDLGAPPVANSAAELLGCVLRLHGLWRDPKEAP